jgi:hypothetical protein
MNCIIYWEWTALMLHISQRVGIKEHLFILTTVGILNWRFQTLKKCWIDIDLYTYVIDWEELKDLQLCFKGIDTRW